MKQKSNSEDRALWEEITKGVRPLRPARTKPSPSPSRAVMIDMDKETRPAHKPSIALAPLHHGLGLHRRAERQLRKGDRSIDRSIDLHGMTQGQAHEALHRFIHRAYKEEARCLLIITGKGGREGGVLKREVPRWMNEASLRPFILSFDYAGPRHGGEGALYVLLRKKK